MMLVKDLKADVRFVRKSLTFAILIRSCHSLQNKSTAASLGMTYYAAV